MIKKIIFIILLYFVHTLAYSQQDSIVKLETITVSDIRLQEDNITALSVKISDSLLQNYRGSFTDLFRQQSSIYLKENGLGMVSSPSFRGTNASQTAVIWNGININSQTTGQTDFNNVGLGGFNEITVKSGGGSSFYGSGAIGGSIHLQHQINFKKKQTFSIGSTIGSYDNFMQFGNVTLANKKIYFNAYINHQAAENDYPFLGTDLVNDNGQIENFSTGFNTAYKLGQNDILKAYFSYFTNNRNSARTISMLTKSRLEDENRRFMLAWNRKSRKTTYNVRIAHLNEAYKYFENRFKKHLYSGSEVNSFVANADVDYVVSNKLRFKVALDGNLIEGEGDNIGNNMRRNIAAILSFTHNPSKKLSYTATARKEVTNTFKVPLTGAIDLNYKLSKWYTVGINWSKNYRMPTFNDLYWEGQGNPNLLPETSFQSNFNHFFEHKNNSLQLAGFYIDTKDMIKWAPGENGAWLPDNIARVVNYGLEATLKTTFQYRKHHINISGNYAYVKAIDQETDKELIYVPTHKASGTISYNIKKMTAFYENVFTDDVFTNGSNTENLLDYTVANAGLSYTLNLNKNSFIITGRVNNIFNKKYENVIVRPMPNRNILISLNYKYN